jgi:hypothetical protein
MFPVTVTGRRLPVPGSAATAALRDTGSVDPVIARKAFQAAVEQYPKSRIRLRNRALVMEEHLPK